MKRNKELHRGSELKRLTPLKRTAALAGKTTLARKTPLRDTGSLRAKAKKPAKATKAEKVIKWRHRGRAEKKPVRDPAFLAFLRTKPCDFCGTTVAVHAHHFGSHGTGTKCSDHEAIPLCYAHHIEGWHRHGTLPGRSHDEWIAAWTIRAKELVSEYLKIPKSRRANVATAQHDWKTAFLRAFEGVEPETEGAVSEPFNSAATAWLLRNVWPLLEDQDEWTPVLSWHRSELLVLVERTDSQGTFDLDQVLKGQHEGN